jgi:hypothetical protein
MAIGLALLKIPRKLLNFLFFRLFLLVKINFGIGGGLLDFLFIKGFFFGGIVQGLTFPDWKKIFIPKVNLQI